jgi:hypothetical protein
MTIDIYLAKIYRAFSEIIGAQYKINNSNDFSYQPFLDYLEDM